MCALNAHISTKSLFIPTFDYILKVYLRLLLYPLTNNFQPVLPWNIFWLGFVILNGLWCFTFPVTSRRLVVFPIADPLTDFKIAIVRAPVSIRLEIIAIWMYLLDNMTIVLKYRWYSPIIQKPKWLKIIKNNIFLFCT